MYKCITDLFNKIMSFFGCIGNPDEPLLYGTEIDFPESYWF